MQKNERCINLRYDIPTGAGILPSDELRRHGFRDNLSSWIIPEFRFDQVRPLIEEMKQAGCNVRYNRFDYLENDDLRQQCRHYLEKEAVRIHTSLIKSIADAKERFERAEQAAKEAAEGSLTEFARFNLDRKRVLSTKRALTVAAEHLNAAIEVAILFDNTMDMRDCFESLRLAVAAQTAAFNAEIAARQLPETMAV